MTLPAKRLERGDVKKAVEVALREWPNKSQQEIAEQIGCGQGTVAKVKADIIPRNIIPPTRTDSMGRTRPTTYATRTTRTATSATFNPMLDGGENRCRDRGADIRVYYLTGTGCGRIAIA